MLRPAQLIHVWWHITWGSLPEKFFVLARHNYKVHTNLEILDRTLQRHISVLDTGAGSSVYDAPPS